MRRTYLFLFLALIAGTPSLFGQGANNYTAPTKFVPETPYSFTTVPNDPLNARFYTLKNGLTVIISVNKTEPRLQTMIAVKAGSKNDPATNTGLAHYLEHMLFKGTDKFGSVDFAKEKKQLDVIEALYEQYNKTTDDAKRKEIYHKIDSVSGVAATYAIANEYDKMLGAIGATGTNAFTSVEQTVYINDIPSNQLDKWLTIEGERFRNPVLRLFHTELEAVYEEKNISLDNDGSNVYEKMMEGLFRNHAYGTQTTIGTIEHLKNPSLKEIQKYYNTHYVPNNMAIILAGDVDPDAAVKMIEKHFGYMQSKPVPPYTYAPEKSITSPVEYTVYGPDAESVQFAYRFSGNGTHDALLMGMTDLLLAYNNAGLIDLNLNKQQKVLTASSSQQFMKDYSMQIFSGTPKEGQTLEEVRDLLFGQLDLLKQGKFDETMMKAIVRNMKVDQMQQSESNSGRAFALLDAFVEGRPWEDEVLRFQKMSTLTKKDIVDFVNKNYNNNYVIVYKRKGEDNSVQKVEKPPITQVAVNRDAQSPFVANIMSTQAPEIQPVFVDYKKDIQRSTLKNGIEVLSVPNRDNTLFSMFYVFDMGKNNDKKLPLAIDYLQYLGTDKYSAEQLSKEFFKLGCSFNVSSGDDQVYVSLSGLDESYEDAFKLFEEFLANVKPDKTALSGMVDRILKGREDAKLNKSTILWGGIRSYAMYGKDNPFTDILSESELKALNPEELVGYIKNLNSYEHRVMYYGPRNQKDLTATVQKLHKAPATLKPCPPAKKYARKETSNKTIYFVDYDMVRAEIIWMKKEGQYDPKLTPVISVFNEYFGGGMSSVVFQTIRESKALAYSTFSSYSIPQKKEDPYYGYAYVGTQADKINEAIIAMNELLTVMPKADQSFMTAKEGIRNQIETERTTKSAILFSYLGAQRRGVDYDLRKDVYSALGSMSINDLAKFHGDQYSDGAFSYCVLGSKENINMNELKKYGNVVELTMEDIFGY